MREILFRGKRIDNGEWIEGNFGKYALSSGENISCISIPKKESVAGSLCYDVEPETVGQYTGLTDKNGKKVFEGDVLEVHDELPFFDGYNSEELQFNGKVLFEENTGMYVCESDEQGNAFCNMDLSKCKVIGNIHDNPELLGGDDK